MKNETATFDAVGTEEGEAESSHVEGLNLPTISSLSFEFAKNMENLTSTKAGVFQLHKFAQENVIEKIAYED